MINTLQCHQLEDYVLSYTPEEQRQARELWKKYTARPDVIDFRNYGYNPQTLRYTDLRRQRKIPDTQMSVDALRFANGIRDEMRSFTTQAVKGQMDSEDWYREMLRTMKLSYHATVDVGNGGKPLTDNQKRIFTGIVLLYFTRLNNLAQQINGGVTPFTEAILSRVGMYGLNNKSIWENWRYETARAIGYAEARRIPGPSEHCKNSATRPGCDELIARGWIPIATMPALGQTTCLSNCQCRMEFRDQSLAIYAGLEAVTNMQHSFMDVYSKEGRLLFKYDPASFKVEIKPRWSKEHILVDLNHYRL